MKLLHKFTLFVLTLGTAFLSAPVTHAQSPTPQKPNPIVWKTNVAKLASSNFFIRIGSKYFYGNDTVKVHSDPGVQASTLEVQWEENNTLMRVNFYFRMRANNEWELYDLRTYNGSSQGDWLYFSPKDVLGNEISSLANMHNFASERKFAPKNGSDAEIVCLDCSLTAFIQQPLNVSPQGYSLEILSGLPSSETITLSNRKGTGYGVNALLRDANRNIITDQRDIRYEWMSQNTSIAQVYANNIRYAEGGCAYGIQEPCPYMNGQIEGVNPGVTKILVNVRKNDILIASGEFDVKVVAASSPTPTAAPTTAPSPVPSATPKTSPEPTMTPDPETEQLKQEVEALKGTIGEIQLNVDRQEKELNAVQRMLKSLRDLISRLFGRRAE